MKKLVVIGVVKFKDKILFLKRTSNRETFPNLWQTVSGFIDEGETKEAAVLREVKEETGLDGKITKTGRIFETSGKYGIWINCPFLIQVDSDKVKIDKKEHSEYLWIYPKDIINFNIVEGVEQDLRAVNILD
jgi:8-oxo-dGTP diphosphatase